MFCVDGKTGMLYTKSILYSCKGGRADEHWAKYAAAAGKAGGHRPCTGGAVLWSPGRRGRGHPGAAGKMRRAAAGGSHAPGSLAGGRPRQPDSGGDSGRRGCA